MFLILGRIRDPMIAPLAVLCVIAGMFVGGTAYSATDAAEGRALTERDLNDIARVEDYMNEVTTIRARFIQLSSNGEISEGDFLLSRPGKLLIDYDPPVPVEIRANGHFLVYEDTELEQLTHVPIQSTPAGVLVDDKIALNDEKLEVVGVGRGPQTLEISIVQREEPEAGQITMVFSEQPLQLKRWTVVDGQGLTTTFALQSVEFGVTIDQDIFVVEQSMPRRQDDIE